MFSWVSIMGLIAVFFAPLSGYLIGQYTLVPVMRVLYGIYSVSMLAKCYVTIKYTTETAQGKVRLAQTKNVSMFKMLGEYKGLIGVIFRDKATVQTLIVMVLIMVTSMISNNFFGLYSNLKLGISEQMLALFPILRAIIALAFMFGIQSAFDRLPIVIPLRYGFMLAVIAQLLLIFAPPSNIPILLCYVFIEAVAYSLIAPRKDGLMARNIDPNERARVMGVLVGLTTACSIPFGIITGMLSGMNRMYPFILSLGLYVFAVGLSLRLRVKT
jgi:Na+/melibiose symporter-like transporter